MTQLSRRRFLTLTAAALATPASAAPVTWQGRALGAEVAITLHAPRAQAAPAITQIRALLAHVERLFSLHDPASQLSRLNAAGRLSAPHRDFAALMRLCDQMHRATGGLFDPSVQTLWSAPLIAPLQARLGWHRLNHSPRSVQLAPGQSLTFNGIAQGFATDLARDVLARHGLGKALVNIGEYAALGGPFTLGVGDPVHGMIAQETLQNRARATSSPRATLAPGGRAHIIDPTGQRTPKWSTVSVEADSAAIADAASTAFCLMSADEISVARPHLPGAPARVMLISDSGKITTIG